MLSPDKLVEMPGASSTSSVDYSGTPLLLLMSQQAEKNARDHGSGASSVSAIGSEPHENSNKDDKNLVSLSQYDREPIAGLIGNGSGKMISSYSSGKQRRGTGNLTITGKRLNSRHSGDVRKADRSSRSFKNNSFSEGHLKTNQNSNMSSYWVEMKDGKGRTYYYDVVTKKTRWDKPVMSSASEDIKPT